MQQRYDIELEPEVRAWLDALPPQHYRAVEHHADRLSESPTTLGEPYVRHLGGPLRELRFHLGSDAIRLTYWLAPARRIVFLTVFRKTRMREDRDVQRALRAQKECEAAHPAAATDYHRTFKEQA